MKKALFLAALLVLAGRIAGAADFKTVVECVSANTKVHAEILKIHAEGIADKQISPAEEAEYKAMDARLKAHATTLAKGGLTLEECKTIDKELVKERDTVSKMAETRKATRDLHARNLARHQRIIALHNKIDPSKLSPEQKKEHAAREARLKAHEARLAKGGLTKKEHEDIDKELAKEEAALAAQMGGAKADPMAVCVAESKKEHAEIAKIHAEGLADKQISPLEEKEYKAMDARLKAHATTLAKGGLTLAECQQIDKELLTERAAVTKMAATRVATRAHHAKNLETHKRLIALHKKINPSALSAEQRKEHAEIEARLKADEARLAKGGLTQKEHEDLEKDLAKEEAALANLTGAGKTKTH